METPQHCLLLISMDNEVGRQRRARSNWAPSVLIRGATGAEAPEAFRQRFRFMHTARPETREGIVGCAWSHVLALRRIVEDGLENVIILEDDAVLRQRGRLPAPVDLPTDEAVYFGGCMRTPGPWASQRRDFPEALEAELWSRLKPGLNPVQDFSVAGSEALFVPNSGVARQLLGPLEDPAVRLLHLDLFRRKHRQVRLLWFPNCFAADDPVASQVEGRPLLRDLYAGGPRKIAARREAFHKAAPFKSDAVVNGG